MKILVEFDIEEDKGSFEEFKDYLEESFSISETPFKIINYKNKKIKNLNNIETLQGGNE